MEEPVRFISPPIKDLKNLRQPLTHGEEIVLGYFNKNLPAEWDMYIQPHMNGLRPDFVLMSPSKGIAVFEVKDWDFSALKHYNPQGGLLLIELHSPQRLNTWDDTAEFSNYFVEHQIFAGALTSKAKQQLTIRLHAVYKYQKWD